MAIFDTTQPLKLSGDIDRDLQMQIDYFNNVDRPYVADAFRGIKNEKDGLFNSFRTDLFDQFDAFQQAVNPTFDQFLRQSSNIANQILPWIEQQRSLVEQQFWPNWELVWQANKYYVNLLNALNNAVTGWVSAAWNQAQRTWASQSAINQALSQARSQWLWDIAKVQGEKLAQQQNMLSNFLQLQDSLRKQSFDYQNELIRNPLLQLNQIIQQLWTSLIGWLQWINNAEMQQLLSKSLAWWGGWWVTSQVQQQQVVPQASKEVIDYIRNNPISLAKGVDSRNLIMNK